ncbi:hypothetical protein [Cohnella silvisoli]|uniref:DUF4083 domain-containing protein n=1 Tax=Cohnella silvisoli TaxID=2873699 RepID=A0ABV1KY67_9BACL|nr:hypothetical protein [Cohnella silvisoli]MCD9021852.1 hypothetical protein [Cohnella silvisoli]
MGAFLVWIVSTAVGIFILYLVVKAAINHSVLYDIYKETKHQNDLKTREIKALNQHLEDIKKLLKERENQE